MVYPLLPHHRHRPVGIVTDYASEVHSTRKQRVHNIKKGKSV